MLLLALVVCPFNLVFTSISLKLFGGRYATSGVSRKIGASLSFDRRKYQFFVCLFFSFLGDKCGVWVVLRYQGYMIGGYPFSRLQTLHLRYEYLLHFCQHSPVLVPTSDKKKKKWNIPLCLIKCICGTAYCPKS